MLTPSGTAVDCVKYDNAFRICYSDPNQGSASADYIAEQGLAKKIFAIYDLSLIHICTTSDVVFRQMNLSWGIVPVMCEEKNNTDELFNHAVEVSLANNLIEKGDAVVITAGVPLGQAGTTNMLKVQQIQ